MTILIGIFIGFAILGVVVCAAAFIEWLMKDEDQEYWDTLG